jgi:hypothetical protein
MGCCGCCSASAIDPKEAIAKVREENPEILIEGEEFEYAFAFMRDQVYFTTFRILVKDKQGFTGSSVCWQTIPYSSIKAFYTETAGSFDPDVELGYFPSGISQGVFERYSEMASQCMKVSFKKDGCDLFALQRMLNQKIFTPGGAPIEVAPQPEGMDDGSKFSKFVDLIGGDSRAVDPKIVEAQLKSDPPILLPDETVDMAFRCGRDTVCLTSRRVLKMDVKGITGKRVNYMSYLWSTFKAFAVETTGFLIDRDCEMKLWTSISHTHENKFSMDLRNSSTDIMAIQRYFSDKILGQDEAPPSAEADSRAGQKDSGAGWQGWLCGDMRQIDSVEANRMFHEETPILQGSETCEMAFKAARDMMLFTTKRLVMIDPQGLTGKKVSFTSIPWKNVQAFAVCSAGSFIDKDSEFMIWTDIFYDDRTDTEEYEVEGDDGAETQTRTIWLPEPGLSYIQQDFQKDKVDLTAIGRYLASRCAVLGSQSSQPPTPMPDGLLNATEPGLLEKFISFLGSDYRQVDPAEMDANLHNDCCMALPDEKVQMAWVCGRDTVIFTTHRAMKIDTQGFTGKRVLYLSLPYSKLKAYQVESAGSFDLDAQMKLTIKSPWYNTEDEGLKIDFNKGRSDIIAIQKFLSEQVIGNADGTSAVPRDMLPEQPEGLIGQFLSWLGDDYKQIPRDEVTQKLRSDPAILLPDEEVDIAFKCGRDMIIFTTKRYMKIDTQGWSGQRVVYQTMPYRSMTCFQVTGAASHCFDQDAEILMYTDAGDRGLDVKKAQGDIMQVYTLLNKKCIMDRISAGSSDRI